MNPHNKAVLSVCLVMFLAVVLGGPLLWGFAVSALGVMVWLVASFGWLPNDWFATNLSTLSTVGLVFAVPVMTYGAYRLVSRIYRIEYALITGAASAAAAKKS
ncbi:MAG: hypothetical protein EXQ93_00875 [Alphaproteobacteria bacterium]|nr:hypothetical protein [Alphaproteobacteria bacterium]